MDPSVVAMLASNNVTKLVFNEVLKHRRVQFKDLRESLTKAVESDASKFPQVPIALQGEQAGASQAAPAEEIVQPAVQQQVEEAVQQLRNAKLIEERTATIKDFSTYYVTEEGLNAEREMRSAAALK